MDNNERLQLHLTLYQTLVRAIVTAIETRPGADPDRASFATAREAAKDLLIKAENSTDDLDPIGDIGRAVLADLHQPRRPHTSARKVKSPLSRYNKKDPHRPERATAITAIDIAIQHPSAPQPATRRSRCLTTAPGP